MNQIQRQERQYGSSLSSGDQRQVFQIDRDRIIYSVAFRRLAQVTQVVSVNEGSLFHNRLTHSLKVAQVPIILGAQAGREVEGRSCKIPLAV
jgi:dGTPase